MDLILASASPRRRDLLAMLGLSARQVAADIDESLPLDTPLQTAVVALAERKAAAVAKDFPHALVLAADTLVALDGRLYGKPKDASEARATLRALSGKAHDVATGFCLRCGETVVKDVVTTQVVMAGLDAALIDAYINSGEPFGKAGAYAIQGRGAALVEQINGDFFNVVGLPVSHVVRALRRFAEQEFLHAFSGNDSWNNTPLKF